MENKMKVIKEWVAAVVQATKEAELPQQETAEETNEGMISTIIKMAEIFLADHSIEDLMSTMWWACMHVYFDHPNAILPAEMRGHKLSPQIAELVPSQIFWALRAALRRENRAKDAESELAVGLCAARHEMPVNEFIFDTEVNPLDVATLQTLAKNRLRALGDEHKCPLVAIVDINYEDDDENYVDLRYRCTLRLYVTGLTVALIAAIEEARNLFDKVVLMHYDRDTGKYYEQWIKTTSTVDKYA